jgi:hypothetical protein
LHPRHIGGAKYPTPSTRWSSWGLVSEREIAARPGIGMSATLEARGHAELEARTTSAYDGWVAGEGFHVRRRDNVDRIADVVKFNWEAVSADGEVTGVGLAFLVLGPDGRIRLDFQFIES